MLTTSQPRPHLVSTDAEVAHVLIKIGTSLPRTGDHHEREIGNSESDQQTGPNPGWRTLAAGEDGESLPPKITEIRALLSIGAAGAGSTLFFQ